MNAAIARLRGLWPPRSLFMRLSLIFVAGLLAAQTLSYADWHKRMWFSSWI